MPVGDLPGWKLVIAEDFDDNVPIGGFIPNTSNGALTPAGAIGHAAYASRFKTYPDTWKDTSGNALYYPSRTLSTSNSCADIYLHTEVIDGVSHALGATIHPNRPDGSYRQLYGRWSYRMRAFDVTGPHFGCVALAIDPATWPGSGEMDFPEGDISGAIGGFNHFATTAKTQQRIPGLGKKWSEWHVYTVEWSPGLIRYLIDDVVALTVTDQVGSQPLAWLIQTGSTGGVPDPATTGHVQIDWIYVYDYVAPG